MQRLGPPDASARRRDRFTRPLRLLFAGASVCTACVALWLLWACAAILPAIGFALVTATASRPATR